MKILAIDTATEACSAALYIDGEISAEYELAPREHTQLILPMLDRLLNAAGIGISQLDALSYARGPGAFTGVRIAAGVIQGLSYAAEIPVLPVSTLAAIAAGVFEQHGHRDILTAIDARMGEVYWAAYRVEAGCVSLQGRELVSSVENLPQAEAGSWAGAGSGWSAHKASLTEKYGIEASMIYADYLPSAESIVQLAAADYQLNKQMPAHQAQPVYLRDNVAKKKQNQSK
ncbi:MAG: tRNA (adenosine(37)-N6)-threonylcarbamoyltransferase complex dimerization subunit type 1 TsaB [Gammaproteobacteria bacterium]|nr:tRNA (adenosine(37)-N6)-threonylcarbamoyltransferase complex dimerization subunit type 1 TsaB [Gammaproteobacteria bacterium]